LLIGNVALEGAGVYIDGIGWDGIMEGGGQEADFACGA
jgi:hypothetical protein